MIQGTTPTLDLILEDESIDLGLAAHVYVSLTQGAKKLRKTGDDVQVDGHIVRIRLTQEESLAFDPVRGVEAQLNWTYANGNRGASYKGRIPVADNAEKEVLE